jgi:hypothetical protein
MKNNSLKFKDFITMLCGTTSIPQVISIYLSHELSGKGSARMSYIVPTLGPIGGSRQYEEFLFIGKVDLFPKFIATN